MRAWSPAGPDTLQDMPACLRLPDLRQPRAAPDHLPGRARSAADLSPALPASAARVSPRSGEFCHPTPLARKTADKNGPLAAGTHLANHSCAGRKADHGTGSGKGNHRAAEADPDVCASALYREHSDPRPRQGPAARARRSTPLATRRIDPQRPHADPVSAGPDMLVGEQARAPPLPGLPRARRSDRLAGDEGDFCRLDPLARKEATKRHPCRRSSLRDRGVSRVEMLIRRCRSFDPMRRQKGSQKEPDLPGSSLGRYAVQPPLTPGLKSGIHLIAGRLLGIRERTACERKGNAAQMTGSSMNAVRQAEIDQHSRELAMRRMSDTFRLSGTAASSSQAREAAQ